MNNKAKKKIMEKKWKSLKARGIHPPKDKEEQRLRLKEAHHGS